ncbi:MAG: response regulator transcription factor [Candidatus Eremiobacteraeota bacterium]|nr:response regulator transcription factor [Candidatus Eremiobacteraeota bacterium]MBV8262785.1 response regulator transcription factor [Candidatus Eremiobacteraeota bacterium]MBV8668019.1 response regulator transcription factor [Candidatus Eremiobacteraeota bacterium]
MKLTPLPARVLVVDDEKRIREMLQIGLERQGFVIRCLPSGQHLAEVIDEWQPEVVLLDVMLPGANGFTLLPRIRHHTQAPIIMLTAKGDVDDRVTGLQLGADDYLAKPFALSELVARITAALRRPSMASYGKLQYADLVVDPRTREVSRAGVSVTLTNREFSLLVTLLREPHRIFAKEQLLDLVWGHDFEGDSNVVETYISYLRTKLDATYDTKLIQTVRFAGYTLRAVKRKTPVAQTLRD